MKKKNIALLCLGVVLCVAAVVLSLMSFNDQELLQISLVRYPLLLCGIPFAGGIAMIYLAIADKPFAIRLTKILLSSGLIVISIAWAIEFITFFADEPSAFWFAFGMSLVWVILAIYLFITALLNKPAAVAKRKKKA